jgi:hypothetical protein
VSAAQTRFSGRVTAKANSAVNARKLLLGEGRGGSFALLRPLKPDRRAGTRELFPLAFAAVPRDFFHSFNVLIMVSLYFFNSFAHRRNI